MNATNRDVYEKVTKPLVDSAVNGFNATIFAYGQTSSGKYPLTMNLATANFSQSKFFSQSKNSMIGSSQR